MAYRSAEEVIAGFKQFLGSPVKAAVLARSALGYEIGNDLRCWDATTPANVRHYLTWITPAYARSIAEYRECIPRDIQLSCGDAGYGPEGCSFRAMAMYLVWAHECYTCGNGED